jgi:hypothetical protein
MIAKSERIFLPRSMLLVDSDQESLVRTWVNRKLRFANCEKVKTIFQEIHPARIRNEGIGASQETIADPRE